MFIAAIYKKKNQTKNSRKRRHSRCAKQLTNIEMISYSTFSKAALTIIDGINNLFPYFSQPSLESIKRQLTKGI